MRLLSPAYVVGGLLLSGVMTVGLASAGAADTEATVCNGLPVTIDLNTAVDAAATEGPDVILGTSGGDTINGLGGDDTICGGEGDDRLFGEDGGDTLVGGSGNDSIGDGVIEACDEDENVYLGGDGDDSLHVNCASLSNHTRIIQPGAGNDVVTWPYAGDEIGSDTNYLSYADVAGPVEIDLNPVEVDGRMVVKVTGGAGTDIIRAARDGAAPRVRFVTGSQGDDTITGTDLTEAPGSWSAVEELNGGPGADTIHGGAGRDFLSGDAGADRLHGDAGGDVLNENGLGDGYAFDRDVAEDRLFGGAGDDKVYAGMGDDVIDLGDGQDEISYEYSPVAATVSFATTTAQDTGLGRDTISGTETVTGSRFADTLAAGIGASTLVGGDGTDQLVGGPGDDIFKDSDASVSYAAVPGPITMTPTRTTGGEVTVVGQGTDTFEMWPSSGHGWSLIGSAYGDVIEAGFFCDVIAGAGDDRLVPGGRSLECDDYAISGGDGDDILEFQRLDAYLDYWSARFDGGAGLDMVSFAQWSSATYTIPVGADGVIGSPGPDRISGDARANRIDTGAGDDDVFGGAGNDAIDAGAGDDTVGGEAGDDSISGSAGLDELDGGDGSDRVDGGADADTVRGGLGDNTLIGGLGDDLIEGSTTKDSISGGDGNDTVKADAGNDTVDLGAGNDTAYAGDGYDTVTAGAGADAIHGEAGDDRLDPGTGVDSVFGDAGNDTILGAAAVPVGGQGDEMSGGSGTDTVTYSSAKAGARAWMEADYYTAEADSLAEVESMIGSAYSDDLRGDHLANRISGGSGNDHIEAFGGKDVISGGDGNDTIDPGAGDDVVTGSDGTDTVSYGSASKSGVRVTLATTAAQNTGGSGYDRIGTIENLTGSSVKDVLTGSSGNNVINGSYGNDTISGGRGSDRLIGGAGTDTVTYASAGARVTASLTRATGGAGTDVISGFENLTGSRYDDKLEGNGARNVLQGGGGRDVLYGYGADDRLYGGSGPDRLNGGSGRDYGNGGTGSDTATSIEVKVSVG